MFAQGPRSNGYRARIYPRATAIWPLPQPCPCIVLPVCSATQTRVVPNVALSSPPEVAIECFLGCMGQLSPTHWRQSIMNHAHCGLCLHIPTLLSSPALFLTLCVTIATHKKNGPLPPPLLPAQKLCPGLVQGQAGYHLSGCSALPLSYSPP